MSEITPSEIREPTEREIEEARQFGSENLVHHHKAFVDAPPFIWDSLDMGFKESAILEFVIRQQAEQIESLKTSLLKAVKEFAASEQERDGGHKIMNGLKDDVLALSEQIEAKDARIKELESIGISDLVLEIASLKKRLALVDNFIDSVRAFAATPEDRTMTVREHKRLNEALDSLEQEEHGKKN